MKKALGTGPSREESSERQPGVTMEGSKRVGWSGCVQGRILQRNSPSPEDSGLVETGREQRLLAADVKGRGPYRAVGH